MNALIDFALVQKYVSLPFIVPLHFRISPTCCLLHNSIAILFLHNSLAILLPYGFKMVEVTRTTRKLNKSMKQTHLKVKLTKTSKKSSIA